MLENKSVLITGGTGTLGRALVARLTKKSAKIRRLVVLSRDELKQSEMASEYPEERHPAIRFFLGDVRDRNRLRRAFSDIDVVIHAAALKQVPAAEYNPIEFIHTNVLGAENVIEAAIDSNVKIVIALSTDKAAAPTNLYGATKLCSDKLFIAANKYSGSNLKCAIVRYGNVMASRGSVVPLFLERAKTGILPITHPDMTRFNITIDEGVDLVLWAIKNTIGGEIWVPKIPSFRVIDLAEAIGPRCEHDIVGIRPGEKIHEEMITESDGQLTIDIGKYYAIVPTLNYNLARFLVEKFSGSQTPEGFSYNSGNNGKFLDVGQLRRLIKCHANPDFNPL